MFRRNSNNLKGIKIIMKATVIGDIRNSVADRQTDRQTDMKTDRQTDRQIIDRKYSATIVCKKINRNERGSERR